VLRTADQFGVPSSSGLPASLDVVITQTSGTGPLLGTTNVNIGTAGLNGMVQFADLRIDSVGTDKALTAATPALNNAPSGNLLSNGNFNTALGAEWSTWGDAGGWINQEIISPVPALAGVYDGTLQMTLGAGGGGGPRGMYQTVAGTAGDEYTLSLQAGAQDWWWPNGKAYLKFLDAGSVELASHEINTTASFNNWDVGVPYQNFAITRTAPAGTTQVKVELVEWAGTGSAWFDNAALTERASTFALLSATTLPFAVQPAVLPTSQTNRVAGMADNGDGTFMIQFIGTPGVRYYVEATTNLAVPVVWVPVPGSTNTVGSPDGIWECMVTNSAGQQFYRGRSATP
jgi:hypothetical protein